MQPMILALLAPAFAAPDAPAPSTPADVVVVHGGGDSAAVVARVATLSGTPSDQLRAISVEAIVAGRPPGILGGGRLTPCGTAPTRNDSISRSLEIATGAVAYMEYGSAKAALDQSIRDVDCLQEAVEPTMAARVWYLSGIVAHASGDQAGTRVAFRQAILFQPDLEWDENFKPDARMTFDAVSAEMKSSAMVPLRVVPMPPDGALRIDGRPVKVVGGQVSVIPGAHHLQVGTSVLGSARLEVDVNAPAAVVLPQYVTDEALDWAGDGDKRGALAVILAGALGTSGNVLVATDTVLWRVRLGGSAWDVVGASAPAASAGIATPPGKRHRRAGRIAAASGAAILLGGGTLATLGYLGATDAYSATVANGRTPATDAAYASGAGQ